MARTDAQLGTGIGFPLIEGGGFRWVVGDQAVEQALRHLLLTEPGERIGRPTYGVGLRQFLFSPNNLTTRTLIRQAIASAIDTWERRVRLDDVVVETSPDEDTVLFIDVRYRLKGDPGPRNLVFPFYLQGGSR